MGSNHNHHKKHSNGHNHKKTVREIKQIESIKEIRKIILSGIGVSLMISLLFFLITENWKITIFSGVICFLMFIGLAFLEWRSVR